MESNWPKIKKQYATIWREVRLLVAETLMKWALEVMPPGQEQQEFAKFSYDYLAKRMDPPRKD